MSSDDGGPGTGSSSVRRTRYSRGAFAGGRNWPGAGFRVLAAASPLCRVVVADVLAWLGARFCVLAAASLLRRVVVADVPAWLGARFRALAAFLFFRVAAAGVAPGEVRACAEAGSRLLPALFPFLRVVALLALVILVVRDLAFGCLAERRSAGDFTWAFAV
jgi:hypothetical protein